MRLPQGTPAPDVDLNSALVYRLLKAQHPDLQHLSIRFANSGWDNATFRLGNDLAVRLPRRELAATLILHEQTWLPHLAAQLPLPVPLPCRLGKPTAEYPWHWSVLPWFEGVSADQSVLGDGEAKRFADFLRSLHSLAPSNAPKNPYRGVPLSHRVSFVEEVMAQLTPQPSLLTPQIRHLWQNALNAPVSDEMRWIHGDLHPRNILVAHGAISGIIDWGDITSGDVATDLAAIWMLFDEQRDRQQAIAHYGMSLAEQTRAQGWAIFWRCINEG